MLEELVVDEYGVSLHKKSERLVVKKEGKVIGEYATKMLNDLVIGEKCGTVSVGLLNFLINQGIQVHFVNFKHEPSITLYTPAHHGTTKTRREQLTSYNDDRGVYLAKEMVRGKLTNQTNTLKYYLRSRDEETKSRLNNDINRIKHYAEEIKQLDAPHVENIQPSLRSLEAHAAKHYWHGFNILLEGKIPFPGRQKRGTVDPINMMLNYSYSILESRVKGAILKAGLDPYAGFIHNDRSGKTSLVYDLIEEFRQPIVDRVVLSLLSRGFKPDTQQHDDGAIFLNKPTKEHLRENIFKRLDSREAFRGKEQLLKTVIQLQARAMGTFFKDRKPYKAFVARW
jgi:CRISPR-associated protein Cas1